MCVLLIMARPKIEQPLTLKKIWGVYEFQDPGVCWTSSQSKHI